MKWSSKQQRVIDVRNKNILVSAAAGSGKTAVLVERIIKKITDKENPVDIDRLVVVTFTKAAAAEMKDRVRTAIERALEKDPEDENLLRQSSLVHNAMITTIDSFCLFVVRNYFDTICLEPNFRVGDEGELKLLAQDVMKAVFEQEYQSKDKASMFYQVVDSYANKRSDQPVKDIVMAIYERSCSQPWPREWIMGLNTLYQIRSTEELLAHPFIQENITEIRNILHGALDRMAIAYQIIDENDFLAPMRTTFEKDEEKYLELLTYEDSTEFLSKLSEFSFDRMKAVKLDENYEYATDTKNRVAALREKNKSELDKLRKDYASQTPEEKVLELEALAPIVEEFTRLALLFLESFEQEKRKKRIVDFGDIEHMALQILVDSNKKEPTETALAFQKNFDEIMIDEYQDSNQVQEEILKACSKESMGVHNIFMVGDVKQSIYRFRMARPELFMEKFARYEKATDEHERIDLSKNYRSRKEVLNFTNDMFFKLMHHDLGSVTYTEEVALHPEANYPQATDADTEIYMIECKELASKDKKECMRLEAEMVAQRIRKLLEEGVVRKNKDSQELRPVTYSDIVLLFRASNEWGPVFAEVLMEYGIPACVQSQTGYFSATEIQTVLSLLKLLDNPLQDIPMAAVLTSYFVGLSNQELASLRLVQIEDSFAKTALFYMLDANRSGELSKETYRKLQRFGAFYESLRKEKDLTTHQLLQRIYEESGYRNFVAALPAGKKREANLDMLLEKAIAFEKTSYQGIFHFLRYIEKLRKYDVDFGEADIVGENSNVVRIMSIHKSKGLEFPIVFVCGIAKEFNKMDARSSVVLHGDLGLGITKQYGKPRRKDSRNFVKSIIADRITKENLGEELRILYVAFTRAKEKLILTGHCNSYEEVSKDWVGNVKPNQPIAYGQRLHASHYLDWIGPAILSYQNRYEIIVKDLEGLKAGRYRAEAERMLTYEDIKEELTKVESKEVDALKEGFAYTYPYQEKLGKKSKYSVSDYKHASMEEKYEKAEGTYEKADFLEQTIESYVPFFAKELGATEEEITTTFGVNKGALRGTAVHRVMECLDFVKLYEVCDASEEKMLAFVKDELSRMTEEKTLEEELRALVSPSMIVEFIKHPIAKRMAKAAKENNLFVEKPFVMDYEDALLQGIIDVFWLEEDKLILLDYKTDRISDASDLVLRYEKQLELYAKALERVFSTETKKVEVAEKMMYSFRLKEVVTV